MKTSPYLISLLVALSSGLAQAQQLHLNWDDCASAGGAKNKNLDCASSTATSVLFASVTSPTPIEHILYHQGVIDIQVGTDPNVMPAFWQFNAGGCGNAQLAISHEFTPGPNGCFDAWNAQMSGTLSYGGISGPVPDGNRARLQTLGFPSTPIPDYDFTIPGGNQETYICRLIFRQAHLASCPGCEAPVYMVYYDEIFSNNTSAVARILNPDFATANGGLDTPVKPTSWGSVKSLYR